MSYLLNVPHDLSAVETKARFRAYRAYLKSAEDRFPPGAYAFAAADWHYDPEDHRCPHDSWVESLSIVEPASGDRREIRGLEIRIQLLGAYHDGRARPPGAALLTADHFDGSEEWGIPGGHGFVGPFLARGANHEIDLDALAVSPALRFDGYPRDGRPHLVKVTLMSCGGYWERHIEIDGHAGQYTDHDWRALPVPQSTVVCTRFAVFFTTPSVGG